MDPSQGQIWVGEPPKKSSQKARIQCALSYNTLSMGKKKNACSCNVGDASRRHSNFDRFFFFVITDNMNNLYDLRYILANTTVRPFISAVCTDF